MRCELASRYLFAHEHQIASHTCLGRMKRFMTSALLTPANTNIFITCQENNAFTVHTLFLCNVNPMICTTKMIRDCHFYQTSQMPNACT